MIIKKYRLEYSKDDIDFVKCEIEKSLKKGYLTDGGPNVDLFEELWCEFNNLDEKRRKTLDCNCRNTYQ